MIKPIRAIYNYLTRPEAVARLKKPEGFGWREAVAISMSVLVTLLIYVFREPISRLDELGYIGAFAAMLLTSATLVLPTGGLIMIFILGGTLPNPWLLALIAGIGSAMGEFTGYLVGYSGRNVIAQTKTYKKVHMRVEKNATWTIFFLALIPSPFFDVAGIAAGVLKLSWWEFFFPTAFGKVLKMLVVALAGYYSVGWVERLL